jgi:hypothetical protein
LIFGDGSTATIYANSSLELIGDLDITVGDPHRHHRRFWLFFGQLWANILAATGGNEPDYWELISDYSAVAGIRGEQFFVSAQASQTTVTTASDTTVEVADLAGGVLNSITTVSEGSTFSVGPGGSTYVGPSTVPNVKGDTQAAATSAIAAANLIVGIGSVTHQSSMTIIPGLVISQSPSAGSFESAGSAVSLVVSSGSTCADLALVKAAFGSKRGQPNYNPVADVNNDGVVNIIDLSMVARALPAGTTCN